MKKIDLYFNSDYWLSTNQFQTCKAAVKRALLLIQEKPTNLRTLVETRILKSPDLLKARFDHVLR